MSDDHKNLTKEDEAPLLEALKSAEVFGEAGQALRVTLFTILMDVAEGMERLAKHGGDEIEVIAKGVQAMNEAIASYDIREKVVPISH